MYSGSSGLLGSLVMPLRLSVLIWCWSMTQSSALRLLRALIEQPAENRNAERNSLPEIGRERQNPDWISASVARESNMARFARPRVIWAAYPG